MFPTKSIFASKTFWGAVLTMIAAIAPTIGEAVKVGRLETEQTVNIVIILATTTATVMGRVAAEVPVYTPDGLPGADKKDFENN